MFKLYKSSSFGVLSLIAMYKKSIPLIKEMDAEMTKYFFSEKLSRQFTPRIKRNNRIVEMRISLFVIVFPLALEKNL